MAFCSKGTFLVLLSGFVLSSMGVWLKFGKQMGYTPMELLMSRCVVQVVIATIIGFQMISFKPQNPITSKITFNFSQLAHEASLVSSKTWFLLVLRGSVGAAATICYTESLSVLPMGDAISIINTCPILTSIIAYIVLGETITKKHIISLFITVIGVCLIVQPSFLAEFFHFNSINNSNSSSQENMNINNDKMDREMAIGYVYAVIGAFITAMVYVVIRLLKGVNSTWLVISHGGLTLLQALIVNSIFASGDGENEGERLEGERMEFELHYSHILLLFGIGMCGYIGQWAFNTAVQLLPTSKSSILKTTQIIWSYVWQIIFFDIMPNVMTVVGALSIIFSTIYVSLANDKSDSKHEKKS